MPMIEATRIDHGHSLFCKHMGLSDSSWRSIMEYALYLDFGILNVARKDVRREELMWLSDSNRRALEMLEGTHASTIMAAYKHRRYSWQGRLKAVTLTPTYMILFLCCIVVAIVSDLFDGW